MMPASGKICTFDCIYCENGLNAERPCHEPYNTAAVVLNALEAKLREMAAEGELPDVITFAGNGEPTAAPEFPQAIAGAVALRDELAPNSKIAVLSNGYARRPPRGARRAHDGRRQHPQARYGRPGIYPAARSTRWPLRCGAPDRDVREL